MFDPQLTSRPAQPSGETAAAADPAPGPGRPPLRGVVADWGGVMTNPIAETVRAWIAADEIEYASYHAVMKAWVTGAYDGAGEDNPIHGLERGECSDEEFEEMLAAQIVRRDGGPVTAAGLLDRMFAATVLSEPMQDLLRRVRAAGLKTAQELEMHGRLQPGRADPAEQVLHGLAEHGGREHPVQQPRGGHWPAVPAHDLGGEHFLELLVAALPAFQPVDRVVLARPVVRAGHPGLHDRVVAGVLDLVRGDPGPHGLRDGVGHHPAPVRDHPAQRRPARPRGRVAAAAVSPDGWAGREVSWGSNTLPMVSVPG